MEHNLLRPEIVLIGLPNSGKSSLFNFLLRDERAIVSSIAGTTRDFISENITIEGVRYKLIDTAGIREAADLIEAEGIKRSKKKLSQSFFSLLLINPFELDEEFSELMKLSFDLIYFTHADLPGFQQAREKLVALYPRLGPIGAVSLASPDARFESEFFLNINKKYLSTIKDNPILLDRHKILIGDASKLLENYINLSTYETDVAILSHELNILASCLSELIGIVSPDQILNSIFSNFCIGK